MIEADRCLFENAISLRVGHQIFRPEPGISAAALEGIVAYNAESTISSLPDYLNPSLLDTNRVAAFLDGLCRLPQSSLIRLRHSILHLNTPGLQLSPASPITTEMLRLEFDLDVPDHGRSGLVQPTLIAAVDEEHARQLSIAAYETTRSLMKSVRDMESYVASAADDDDHLGADLRKLSELKFGLFAAASAWRDNAAALAMLYPDDKKLAQDLEEAQATVLAHVAPPQTGMPGPPG